MTELAVGWVLHALEPNEELDVARHISGCAQCRSAVLAAEDVAAGLGSAVRQVEPPAGLRASILDAVAETPQNVLTPPSAASTPPLAPTVRAVPEPPLADRPASWLTRGRLVTAAAALVAVVTTGGFAVRTAQLETERAAQNQVINKLLGTLALADSQHAVLRATSDNTIIGAVIADAQGRQVLTVDVPPNQTADTTYVLWGIPGGGTSPVALGTFDVTSTAPALRPVAATDQASFPVYAVSLEPGRMAPPAPSNTMAKGQLT